MLDFLQSFLFDIIAAVLFFLAGWLVRGVYDVTKFKKFDSEAYVVLAMAALGGISGTLLLVFG